jgi:hypothetical protein
MYIVSYIHHSKPWIAMMKYFSYVLAGHMLHVEWHVAGVARDYCHALSASPQGDDAVRLSSGMAHSGFEV